MLEFLFPIPEFRDGFIWLGSLCYCSGREVKMIVAGCGHTVGGHIGGSRRVACCWRPSIVAAARDSAPSAQRADVPGRPWLGRPATLPAPHPPPGLPTVPSTVAPACRSASPYMACCMPLGLPLLGLASHRHEQPLTYRTRTLRQGLPAAIIVLMMSAATSRGQKLQSSAAI